MATEKAMEEALHELSEIQTKIKTAIAYRDSIVRMLLAAGATYAQIGTALGIGRSATWQQYGPRGARNGRSNSSDQHSLG